MEETTEINSKYAFAKEIKELADKKAELKKEQPVKQPEEMQH